MLIPFDSRNTHYHIRWKGHEELDWERFNTAQQADLKAKDLMAEGEGFTIEKFDETCPRCAQIISQLIAKRN